MILNKGKMLPALLAIVCLVGLAACKPKEAVGEPEASELKGIAVGNEKIKQHVFLQCMLDDDYYPKHLVAKGQAILQRLCEAIEQQKPADLGSLYTLTQASTDEFNELAGEFVEANSEIETMARDCIGEDFVFIATAYDFENADAEELIATRDW